MGHPAEEKEVFENFLNADPLFAGARITNWFQPKSDPPDIECDLVDGRKIGIELASWIEESQIGRAKIQEFLEESIRNAIKPEPANHTEHISRLWMFPKRRLLAKDIAGFRTELLKLTEQIDRRWESAIEWHTPQGFRWHEFSVYPMLGKYLDAFNEGNINKGLNGRDLRGAFVTEGYNVLIVANKFQTGFDQPLLVAMYVDKRLAGVTAVQTLSRLNRIYPPDKDTTFVLDFIKQEDEILKAFRLYYRKAELSGVTDPNLVHDLHDKLDAEGIYTAEEVDAFVQSTLLKKQNQAELLTKLTPAVERFRVRQRDAISQGDEKAQDGLELFRRNLTVFVRTYDFLSQIVDYGSDTSLEKRGIFFRHLAPLLDIPNPKEPLDLSRVTLTHFNIKDLGQHRLALAGGTGDQPKLDPLTAVGSAKIHDPDMVRLKEIIQKMNDLFEGELTDADQINFVNHIRDKMLENPVLAQQAAASQKDQFSASPDFHEAMMTAVVNAYDNHMSMSEQVLRKDNVKAGLKEILKDLVYEAFAKTRPEVDTGA